MVTTIIMGLRTCITCKTNFYQRLTELDYRQHKYVYICIMGLFPHFYLQSESSHTIFVYCIMPAMQNSKQYWIFQAQHSHTYIYQAEESALFRTAVFSHSPKNV